MAISDYCKKCYIYPTPNMTTWNQLKEHCTILNIECGFNHLKTIEIADWNCWFGEELKIDQTIDCFSRKLLNLLISLGKQTKVKSWHKFPIKEHNVWRYQIHGLSKILNDVTSWTIFLTFQQNWS